MATELVQEIWTRLEALPASGQDAFTERMLKELDEFEEAEWDALVSSPASLRFLDRVTLEIDEARARGELRDGEDDLRDSARCSTKRDCSIPSYCSSHSKGGGVVTDMLKAVCTQVEALPPAAQDAIAERMQGEIDAWKVADDAAWDALLATPESRRLLTQLAAEARAEYRAGQTVEVTEDW